VAGGVRIDGPGADLAIALAIASAAKGVPLKASTASFGEVGLTGRLRPATQAERRAQECAKLGLSAVLVPKGTDARANVSLVEAETLRQAVSAALDKAEPAAA
jgi:DNA repair protein RadA/Sms